MTPRNLTRFGYVAAIVLGAAVAYGIAGCDHPEGWRVELKPGVTSEPQGWQAVMDAAKAQATCTLNGLDPEHSWGGVITVYPPPYYTLPDGRRVVGDNVGDHSIGVVWSPLAMNGALPEEACHAWLGICEKDFTEPPAKSCAVAVKSALP
jgi:hypothetical protein